MRLELDLQVAPEVAGHALPSAAALRRYARAAMAGHRSRGALTIRIVGEPESQALNARYRQRNHPTNVLSFPYENPPGMTLSLLGDLVICAPVVEREAREQGKPVEAHWAHLIAHGMLHLLGYEHQDDAQAQIMEALEIAILDTLGYPNPYLLAEPHERRST
ncbi:rRNA maturation RNase YbeY [Ectothiorhodospiraceae bacterium 2226]|nr:rRNA maturation RNase YbeY [Ectothiorhodospiraceae bacterium 2226]